MELSFWSINTVNGFPHPALISESNPLWLSSPAGSNQYLFSMLIMCSGIFGPLGGRSSLEKSAWSQDPLIQSMLPAGRQLVCHLSMIPPWAMDFSGWATCRVCAWFSGRVVPVGTDTHRKAMLWRGSCTLFFSPRHRRVESCPVKA